MRRIAICGALCLLLATSLFAQAASKNATVSVMANNVGQFTFTVDPTFDFGDVDAYGDAVPSSGVTSAAITGGREWTATGALNWLVESAPARTVSIYINSSSSSITAGTPLPTSQLLFWIPSSTKNSVTTSNPITTFLASNNTGSPAGNLITGLAVGKGTNNRVTGLIDLKLQVLETDIDPGVTTFTVVLTASGS